jgi:single-strand DNA-binding protein
VTYLESGNIKATFSVATNEEWTDKQGLRQKHTEWHNIIVWGRKATVVERFLKKGSEVLIDGRIRRESWEDNGQMKYKTMILCDEFRITGTSDGSGSNTQ